MSRSRLVRVLTLSVLLAVAVPAVAEVDWNLALKPDDEILSAVSGLSTEAPGAGAAPAVQLLREAGWEVLPGSRLLYRNVVFLVKDPAAIEKIAESFYLDARGSVESAQVFVVRESAVTRPPVNIERGDGQVHRTRLAVEFEELQAGDIVGFSSITRFDGILYFDKIPMSAPFPVARFSARVRCEQSHTYTIQAAGKAAIDVKVIDRIDARPVEWHAVAEGIAAVESQAGGGVYHPGSSLALIAESSEWVPAANAWISTLAWQRVALFLSGVREAGVAAMSGVRDQAAGIVGGATTDAEKEAAVFAFVRDELGLLVGPPYEPLGYRKGAEVVAAGEANPAEKALMMITLLDAVGVPAELAVVRTEEWGPLREGLQSFAQFFDLAVRCGAEGDRYYVPYVADATAGSLPAGWGQCWVLAPAPGLMQKASQVASEVMSQPNVDMHAAFMAVRERAAEEGWYSLEQVGGGSR